MTPNPSIERQPKHQGLRDMTTILVRSWIPVRKMIRFDDELPDDFYDVLENCAEDLPGALSKLTPYAKGVEVAFETPPEPVLQDLLQLAGSLQNKADWYEFIRIDSAVEYDLATIQAGNEAAVTEAMLPGLAARTVAESVADALCLAQLAYPARIKTSEGRSWVDEGAYNSIHSLGGFPYDLLLPNDFSWPTVGTMKLSDVSSWEEKLGLFAQGVAKTPVQRALASFTHAAALPISSTGEALFWAMQGLESFYCRGTGDLRRQLSEKSKLFLGSWNDKKNIVGRMYDLRSKFVHGDFNLERWNNNQEPTDRSDSDEFYSACMLAIRILFATLHRCISDDIMSAEFDYKLSTR